MQTIHLFDIVESPNDSADKLNHDLEEIHSSGSACLSYKI